ncbi:RraA family protein [Corticibacterium sp. UT-5YL-CI-8]|nr:RraA family protein [Tianweitania sp. UT-5YL-CI-8]
MEKKLTGRIPADRVKKTEVPRPPEGVVEGLLAIDGVTNLVSDIMDEMYIAGVLPASLLRPTLQGKTIVGPALTIRNTRLQDAPFEVIRSRHTNRQADTEAHNLTTPGDILVIQGHQDVSNIGGMSSLLGKRQGSLGAVVWGACRDVAHSRALDFPIWSTAVTPITGKWRMETMEINGDVEFDTVLVRCGDIVVADDSGVCFIPRDRAVEVLERVRERIQVEERRIKMIEDGMPILDMPGPNIELGEE